VSRQSGIERGQGYGDLGLMARGGSGDKIDVAFDEG